MRVRSMPWYINKTNFTYKWVFNFGPNITLKMTIQLTGEFTYTREYTEIGFNNTRCEMFFFFFLFYLYVSHKIIVNIKIIK